MTINRIVKLMITSSDTLPFKGKLSEKENILAAIELAKSCKKFADNGQTDEAMNIDSSQWTEVIDKLNNMKSEL